MDYSDSLKEVLKRKIIKAERDLYQLKLDYCRFVFGLSHRSKVVYEGQVYQVRAVNLDTMCRDEHGEWCKPHISAVLLDETDQAPVEARLAVDLDNNWQTLKESHRSEPA